MVLDALFCLRLLAHQTLALSVGLLLVLALRRFVQRRFGAGVSYLVWFVPVFMVVAASLPAAEPAQALRAQIITRVEAVAGVAPLNLPLPTQPVWPWVLVALWALGFAFCAARLVWLQRRFMRGVHLQGNHWVGPAGSGPALVGLFRPRLLLPADFEQRFDARQQALVLAHEAVHSQRADNLSNAMAAGLCLLHWFNPLVWLAYSRMRADQELACDAAVMARHPGSEASYARALMLAQSPVSPIASPVWANWQSAHPLVERIAMLKNSQASTRWRIVGYALLAAVAVAGAGLTQISGAQSAATSNIELNMDLTLREQHAGGPVRTRHISQVVNVAPGKRQTMVLRGLQAEPTQDQLVVDLWADDVGDGKVLVSAELKRGQALTVASQPRLVTKSGEVARIEVGSEDVDNNEMLSIKVTPTLLKSPKT